MICTLYLPFTYYDNYIDTDETTFKDEVPFNDCLNKYCDEIISYSRCKATLYNKHGNDETIDSLVSYFTCDEPIQLIIKLRLDEMDEEFEEEFKTWVSNHKKIEQSDYKLINEQIRNIKFTFTNLSIKTSYGELINTKLLDQISCDTYSVLVEKIIFTKEF